MMDQAQFPLRKGPLKPPHQPRVWPKTIVTLLAGAGIATAGAFLAWSPGSPVRQGLPQATETTTITGSNADGQNASDRDLSSGSLATVAAANPNFVTDVVKQVGPAVVRIDASRTVSQELPDAFNDPFFRRFFGDQIPQRSQERIERGLGSGFIVSEDGRIITNAHVVDGADTVNVTLKDGRILEGQVLGTDPVTDVAVIKVEEQNLPTVKFSDSEQIQPGEWAIAIGNPLGLDNTVTVGIVSAVGRSSNQVGVPDQRVAFIQTDTAINPGNSGGPLLNQKGEVIGVNTAIINGAQGLGFAIPINTVEKIADQLTETGTVAHPFLGIQMVTLTPQIKEQIQSDPNSGLIVGADQGILIVQVAPGSPADKAGLRAGDVIVKIENKTVTKADEVQQQVEASTVGEPLQLQLLRNGAEQTVQVRPGEFPAP